MSLIADALILAQTTQPSGFASWSPEQWGIFLGFITVLIGALSAAFVKIAGALRDAREAKVKAEEANVSATKAEAKADASVARIDSHDESLRQVRGQIVDVAKAVEPEKLRNVKTSRVDDPMASEIGP